MFADEVLIEWNLSQGLKFLRDVVEDTIFFIIFLPLLFLLLIEEILFRRVKRFAMLGKRALRSGDSLGHFARLPGHDRIVFPNVPHFLRLSLTFLLLSLLLSHRLHPAFLKGLDELGNFQTLPL